MRSIEPGISRFRVRLFEAPRNDGGGFARNDVRRQMHVVTLGSDTDFDGWRKAARALAMNDVRPADVTWRVKGAAPDLFDDEAETQLPDVPQGAFSVPATFMELAEGAILHRD